MANVALLRPGQLGTYQGHHGVQISQVGRAEPDHAPAGSDQPLEPGVVANDLHAFEVVRSLVLDGKTRLRPGEVHPSQQSPFRTYLVLWDGVEAGQDQRDTDT